jgi:type IV pilus assembly protein PilW
MASAPRRDRGFSLVELMVGVAVGLIGIAIITHLYLQNEKYKRSTTAAGGAQVNGAIALYTLEREIRASGYGVNHNDALSCTCAGAGCSPVKYFYNGVAAPTAPLLPFMSAPVIITSVAGSPDAIYVLSSTDEEGAAPIPLEAATAEALVLDGSTAGFTDGAANFVLMAQAGNCVMARVTNVVTGTRTLRVAAAGSPWNNGAGTAVAALTKGANVFNLGVNPVSRTYSVLTTNNAYKLQVTDWITYIEGGANHTVQIIDDIVDVQAEYGHDANGDGAIAATEWTATSPTTPADWQRLLAVRVGVLARAGNYERPEVPGGPCTATTDKPTWAGSIDPVTALEKAGSAFTVPGGLPSCYKYRVFETTVPLRNMSGRP